MSDTFSKVEAITGVARRRRFSTELKLAVVAETMQPGMSVSYVARRHGFVTQPGIPLEAVDERRRQGSRPRR
jgi:transposase